MLSLYRLPPEPIKCRTNLIGPCAILPIGLSIKLVRHK